MVSEQDSKVIYDKRGDFMAEKEHILDYLAREMKCGALSNLCAPMTRFKERIYFEQTSMNRYPLEDWRYAYRYIFNMESIASTMEEMRTEFLKQL